MTDDVKASGDPCKRCGGGPRMKRPDITPAQLVALIGSLMVTATAFGLDLSRTQQDAVMQLVTVLAPVLVVGDAVIRNGRSRSK